MKKKKNRRRLPKESSEISKGARLALSNAQRHLRAADLLGSRTLFGPASSHVIFALEELTKSWVLTMSSIGIDIPKSVLADVLSRHTTRHSLAFGHLFSKAIRNMVSTALIRSFVSGDSSMPRIKQELKREARSSQVAKILKWILEANELKNRGLYVDFDGNRWTYPGRISKQRFTFGYQIAKDLLKEQKRAIRRFQRQRFQADDSFQALFREAVEKAQVKDQKDFLKEMAIFALA